MSNTHPKSSFASIHCAIFMPRYALEKITAIRSATFEVITKHERVVFM